MRYSPEPDDTGTEQRWGLYLGWAAVAMEAFALVLLLAPLPGNSALWFPLNACYFGGILVALAAAFAGIPVLLSDRNLRSAVPIALALAAALLNRLASYR